jgi:hypothetical protein
MQAQQIAALQGMGKEIAPRVTAINAPRLKARDLAGFDRALRYAEAALVKGPKIQLGTGAEGSGVGIIVDNNPTAAARPGTGNAEAIVAQQIKARDVEQPRRRAKVTTMYVRSGVPEGEFHDSKYPSLGIVLMKLKAFKLAPTSLLLVMSPSPSSGSAPRRSGSLALSTLST